MKVTGVILAGGKSSRMGTDKSFVTYKGKQLIEHAIETLSPICDELLISSNSSNYSEFGLKVIKDQYLNKGPLAGLHATFSQSKNDLIVVLPCDNPEVSVDVFNQLIEAIDDNMAAVPVHSQGKEPLIACYNKKVLHKIDDALQNDRLKLYSFLETISVKNVSFDALSLFKNINSQTDIL